MNTKQTDKTATAAPEAPTAHELGDIWTRQTERQTRVDKGLPAEKPTAEPPWEEMYCATAAREEALHKHADKLAEALKCAEMVLAERGVELKEITRALANWEGAK